MGDGPEMSFVKAQDPVRPVSVGEDDERAVREAQIEAFIAAFESGDCCVVIRIKARDGKTASGEIGQERPPCRPAEALAEEMVDLSRRRCRDHERSGLAGKDLQHLFTSRLVGVSECDERCRVYQ